MTEIKEFTDVQVLVEFRRRFNKTCLIDLDMNMILNKIGILTIKEYLKEQDYKIVFHKFK